MTCKHMKGSGGDVTYLHCGTRNDAIEKLVEMMDALVGIKDEKVQYVRFERRPIINDAGADLIVKGGVTLAEGGHKEIGIGYEIKFNVMHDQEGEE